MDILFDKLSRTFLHTVFLAISNFFTNINKAITKNYKKHDAKLFKWYTLKYKYPKEYKKYSKNPIDESKVLFVEIRLDIITNCFSLLFDELVKNYDLNIHSHFLRTTVIKRIDVHRRNIALVRDMATAKVVFVNESSQVLSCVELRPETKIINTWHGCGAFKKFGLSTADLLFGDDRKTTLQYPFYKNNGIVTVSSPEVVWAYNEAMNHKPDENIVRPLGVSRTDFFYKKDYINKAYETLYELFPQAKGKKVILFAPTFRGRVAKATTSTMFNLDMFQKELGDEYVVVCKHHPLVKKIAPIPEHLKDFAVDFTKTMSIEDLLCVSDICISDYSSLVFEYSLFERPLIFFAYDLDTYFDWRGFYYDYFELAPGPICKKNSEMIDYIKNIDTRFDKEKIKAFKQKFMASCDGHSTERIIQEVFGDSLEKYRREVPIEGEFYTLPRPNPNFQRIDASINNLDKIKQQSQKIYETSTINSSKVVIIYNSSNGFHSAIYLKDYISRHTQFDVEIIHESLNLQEAKILAQILGNAKFILMTNNCSLIDVIPKNNEQKIIFIGNETFPIYKFAYNKLENIASLNKELLNVATPYANLDEICVLSDNLKEIYANSMKFGKVNATGSILGDLICDENFKNQTLDLLHEMMPSSVDKKVILYIPRKRLSLKKRVLLEQSILKEYLDDDYVVLFHYGLKDKGAIISPAIYSSFIIDIYGSTMSLLQALSVADIVIGDYRPETMLFTVKEKPIFLYRPDENSFIKKEKLNFDLETLNYGIQVRDADDLVEKIKDIENYNYTNIREFKEKYYSLNDGNTAKRITDILL
ncbi:MAG: CDP-glycerol glycerophosphotransferase family protein [Clostridia bacterium]